MVAVSELLALTVVAFAGGGLGAALGGLRAYSLAGLLVLLGETASIAGGSLPDHVGTTLLGATGITGVVALGPAFGPHVAFAGGVAAAAFAARGGDPDPEFDYHPAKDITRAFGARPAPLIVGGTFGVLGLLLAGASAGGFGTAGSLPWNGLPWDPISFAIVTSALLHRIAFGYPLVGTVRNGLLDMSPYERGEHRPTRQPPDDDDSADGPVDTQADPPSPGTRLTVEPWLPYQSGWGAAALLGVIVGAFSAYVTYATGSVFLPFGIAAAALGFITLDTTRVPVTHHMALPASITVVGLVGVSNPSLLTGGPTLSPADIVSAVTLPLALVAGGLAGAVAGLLGELAQRVLYAHADTHLDPPAVAILLTTLLIAVLDVAGVLAQNVIPTVGL